jgi:ribosomal protein L4
MNLNSVLVIADVVDENLYLASHNLVNILVVEPRYADPVSLVHYKKILVTKAAMDPRRCSHERREHTNQIRRRSSDAGFGRPIVSERPR